MVLDSTRSSPRECSVGPTKNKHNDSSTNELLGLGFWKKRTPGRVATQRHLHKISVQTTICVLYNLSQRKQVFISQADILRSWGSSQDPVDDVMERRYRGSILSFTILQLSKSQEHKLQRSGICGGIIHDLILCIWMYQKGEASQGAESGTEENPQQKSYIIDHSQLQELFRNSPAESHIRSLS